MKAWTRRAVGSKSVDAQPTVLAITLNIAVDFYGQFQMAFLVLTSIVITWQKARAESLQQAGRERDSTHLAAMQLAAMRASAQDSRMGGVRHLQVFFFVADC